MAHHASQAHKSGHRASSRGDSGSPIRIAETAPRGPVLPRLDVPRLRQHLPKQHAIRIEINGVLAGVPMAAPDAVREFAVGWAFMHRFLDAPDQIGTISATQSHVSLMIEGGGDLERLKYEAIGWIPRQDRTLDSEERSGRTPVAVPVMSELDAVATCKESFSRFERDGARVGYTHAAVATSDDVVCMARDLAGESAVAKVLGWLLTTSEDVENAMLVVNGVVGAGMVEAAGRCGIGVVATDAVPTQEAIEAATASCVSVLGLVRSHRRGLFVDGGHLRDDCLMESMADLPIQDDPYAVF